MASSEIRATARKIARSASRLVAEQSGSAKKGTQPTRRALLGILNDSDEVLSVEELSTESGLHVNTVRGHLDVLEAAGDVARVADVASKRGRPRVLYRATAQAHSAADELAHSLAAALEHAEVPELADAAGKRWANLLDTPKRASTPMGAVDNGVVALQQLGFSAKASPLGDTITLGNCPYNAIVEDHPVICAIHTAALSDVFERSGQDVSVASMDVWVQPGVCLARLNRPDLAPAWSVDPQEDSTTEGNES